MSGFDAARWYPSPAKINLFLQITGRREDGYHLLQTVFQLLDWGDEIRVSPRADERIVRTHSQGYAQPVDEAQDLMVRAAIALREACSIRAGADIAIRKQVPMGGGFGGGSSNAATVLLLLNQLWETELDEDALARIGATLGADVPVFVRGHSAWAEGIGERLTPMELPERWFLLVDSGESVSTAALFADRELTRDAAVVKISDFVSGSVRGNAFEPLVRRRSPRVAQALDALQAFGEAAMTGTGGGCFVGFPDESSARAAQASLSGYQSWVAKAADRSALHRALHV